MASPGRGVAIIDGVGKNPLTMYGKVLANTKIELINRHKNASRLENIPAKKAWNNSCWSAKPGADVARNDGIEINNAVLAETERTLAMTVLVVDDEQNFVSLLDWFLTKNGYEVRTALNGKEALGLLDKNSFALALLDLRMGPVDGITLLDELKQRLPDIKVIMMTAYPTADSRTRAFLRGASAYFTKPLDLHDLLQTINRVTSTPPDDANP